MAVRPGWLDDLLDPRHRLVQFNPNTEEGCAPCNGDRYVEVILVGSPPESGAQIRQLGGEPVVRLTLLWAVPPGQDVGFAPGEVASMSGPDLGGLATRHELLLSELADRLQHRIPGPA